MYDYCGRVLLTPPPPPLNHVRGRVPFEVIMKCIFSWLALFCQRKAKRLAEKRGTFRTMPLGSLGWHVCLLVLIQYDAHV